MAKVSCWVQAEGLAVSELSPAAVDVFPAGRAAVGHLVRLRRGSFQPLLGYLRAAGVVPVAEPPCPSTVVDVLLARYASYLAVQRGLAETTIARNVELVRPFLAGLHHDGIALKRLSVGEVTAFVLALSRQRSGSVPRTVTALRSLLRFLHADGLTTTGLADGVPTVARWKLAGLPKALAAGQVAALVATCDRGSVVGRRDFAIMTVLSRLGLRAGEVARLRLDDIDWRQGEITVTGKGSRHERLQLPADVGEVIVSYLTGARPDADVREVFVCVRAPHRAMTRGAVTNVVAAAARKAGLGTVHAHRLRHSAATAMLGAGASLREIGQVLRHRHALTTTIYAKVEAERYGPSPAPGPHQGRRVSPLRRALADYLSIRRALGSKLDRAEKLLTQFVTYLEDRQAATVTVEHALAWATSPTDASAWWLALRLSPVRGFATYLRTIDGCAQVPPAGLIAHGRHRATPYLYSDADIVALVEAGTGLTRRLSAATYPALIALLAVTGMRVGEAIALNTADFNDGPGVLTVRDGKLGKSRLLPLHPTSATGLHQYLHTRDRLRPIRASDALFISSTGTRLGYIRVHRTFRRLTHQAGLAARSATCRPRMESRPGARFRCCHRPVSPDRSPNPPCRLLGNGLHGGLEPHYASAASPTSPPRTDTTPATLPGHWTCSASPNDFARSL